MSESFQNKTIVLIVKSLEGRGAERSVVTLASGFLVLKCQVHILILEDKVEIPLDSEVKLHFIDYKQLKFKLRLKRQSRYKAVAKEIDTYINEVIGTPDLILANLYKINWIMAYSELPNIVNVLHTALAKQFESKLQDNFDRTQQHLIDVYGRHPCASVSEGARIEMLSLIGEIIPTKTIYNPCDSLKIVSASKQFYNLTSLNLITKQYIIHVGSFDAVKDHKSLVRAYAKSYRKIPLVLVGKGKLESSIKALVTELGIQENVKFAGFLSNPYPIIAKASFMVLTSKFEGFGYVIVEAMVLGVPVISVDSPYGPKELLPSKNLISPNDIPALTEKLNQAMQNPDCYNLHNYELSMNKNLSPKFIARQHLQFIHEVNC